MTAYPITTDVQFLVNPEPDCPDCEGAGEMRNPAWGARWCPEPSVVCETCGGSGTAVGSIVAHHDTTTCNYCATNHRMVGLITAGSIFD